MIPPVLTLGGEFEVAPRLGVEEAGATVAAELGDTLPDGVDRECGDVGGVGDVACVRAIVELLEAEVGLPGGLYVTDIQFCSYRTERIMTH